MKSVCLVLSLLCLSVGALGQNKKTTAEKKFSFSLQAGLGQRVASVDETLTGELKNHANALRSGLAVQAEAGYNIDRNNVISLSWGLFSSSNESAAFLMQGLPGSSTARVNTQDRMNLFMLNFTNYFWTDPSDKFRVFGQAGIGLASYRSASDFFMGSSKVVADLNGSGFATNLGLGAEWKFSQSVALVGQANYVMSRVQMKADDPALNAELEGSDKESLNQIRATLGLRIAL
jgi:hypothetical protein